MTYKRFRNGDGMPKRLRLSVESADIACGLTLYVNAWAQGRGTTASSIPFKINNEERVATLLVPCGHHLVLLAGYDRDDDVCSSGVLYYAKLERGTWRIGPRYYYFNNDEIVGIDDTRALTILYGLMNG